MVTTTAEHDHARCPDCPMCALLSEDFPTSTEEARYAIVAASAIAVGLLAMPSPERGEIRLPMVLYCADHGNEIARHLAGALRLAGDIIDDASDDDIGATTLVLVMPRRPRPAAVRRELRRMRKRRT